VHCLTFKEIVQTTAANTRQLFELWP
jgi:hypothetical protein